MAVLQLVIDEMRPVIEQFVADIGIQLTTSHVDLAPLVRPFSEWILQQSVDKGDFSYLASRIAAFISCYMIDTHSAILTNQGGRIEILVPFEQGIVRALDPYALAFAVAAQELSLEHVIASIA